MPLFCLLQLVALQKLQLRRAAAKSILNKLKAQRPKPRRKSPLATTAKRNAVAKKLCHGPELKDRAKR